MPEATTAELLDIEKTSALESPVVRLPYLDGIRGLTALYVVLYHGAMAALPASNWAPHAAALLPLLRLLDGSGPAAVAIFIVLSGYCLTLPTLQTGRVRSGFLNYAKRRALRILPPYYAALAGTLLIIWLAPPLRTPQHVWWDHALPALRWGTIIAHLLLIQDLTGKWATNINGPMWSIAVEWQIYFLFPMVMLPVARRVGIIGMTVTAVLFTTAFYLVSHAHWLHSWFVGIFAIGAAGAAIGFRDEPIFRTIRDQLDWRVIGLTAFAAGVVLLLVLPITIPVPWADLLTATAALSLMIYCTRQLTLPAPARRSLILRVLSARPLILLGAFSYSLYLTHAPVVAAVDWMARSEHLSRMARALVILLPGTAACLIVAYLFFLLFERPFVHAPLRHGSAELSETSSRHAAFARIF